MHFQYNPYVWVLLASAAVTAGLGVYAWRQRTVQGATSFALLMLMAVVWALANALEMAGTDLPTKLFWANVQYLCYVALPVAWLTLALQYTGRDEWLTRRNLVLLSIEPVVTVALVWTNDLHGLMRRNIYLDTAGPFPVIGKAFGPWFWLHAAYTYLLLTLTIYLLIEALRRPSPLYRRQTLVLLIGSLLPMIWNALYNFGLSPIPRYDVAPAVLSLSGIVVAWGLFRYRLFDVVPVARATVMEGMDDGVIVLDVQNRVVDLNPAVQRILGWPASQVIGRPAAEVLGSWPGLLALCRNEAMTQTELVVSEGDVQQCYDVHCSPLSDGRGRQIGQLVVWHDITELRRARTQSLQQERAVAVLEERERLARELHDSLGQVLGYVNVQAQAARELLSGGKVAEADAHLARLAALTQDAQADVRESIVGLKVDLAPERGFFRALQRYLQRFGQSYGIRTELIVPEGLVDGAFEPAAEVQLLRIIQEALSNVRKHAGARRVQVSFAAQGDQARVTVEDDGQGFDPASLPQFFAFAQDKCWERAEEGARFGLRIMRERAEGVGGSLQVCSAPGQGTKVIVQVPLRPSSFWPPSPNPGRG
jgi:PAS domain S-box-containing protein